MTEIDIKELKSIALKNFHRIPGGRGDDFNSYLQTVLNWLAEWIGNKQFRHDFTPGYCALVLAPEIIAGDCPNGAEEVLCFKEDKTPRLGGSIYFTDYAINRVFRYAGTCKELNEIVRMISDNGGLGLPFVAFDTDTQNVYVFADGGKNVTLQFPLRTDIPRPFTIDVFEEMLDDIYEQGLKYPKGYPPIWYKTKERVPCKETELVIQSHVALILKARAQGNRSSVTEPEWLLVVEKQNNAGRIDLAVYRDQSCIVVSEIKVLRHCRFPDPNKRQKKPQGAKTKAQQEEANNPLLVSAKTNEKWALRGVRQATRYKIAESAKAASLVVYDMRDQDTDLPTVREQCINDDVRYLRYYLHNQLPDAR